MGFMMAGKLAKTAGGRRNPEKSLWLIQFGKINVIALEKYIILDARLSNAQ